MEDTKVEIIIRFSDEKTKEELEREREDIKLKKLIGEFDEDYEPEDTEERYIYETMTFDLKDVKAFNRLDDEHITLRLYERDSFAAKVNYKKFKENYQRITGYTIHEIK